MVIEIETARKREEEIKLQNEIFGPHEKNYPYNPSDKYIVLKSVWKELLVSFIWSK